MGGLDRVALLLLLVAIAWHVLGGDDAPPEQPRRPHLEAPPPAAQPRPAPLPAPPPAAMERARPLPPPSADDPVFHVRIDRRRGPSTGTAFSIDPAGLWLTARHVVHECERIGLRRDRSQVRATVAWVHPRADLALLRTQGGTPPLALAPAPLVLGQDGYAIGFPQGRPGAVHGRVLGRSQMQAEGRFAGRAPTIAWAERGREPDFSGSIGGISGGPVLDARGHVVGVIVAETPRRGRFETIAPEVLAAGASRPLPVGDPSAREVDLSPRTLPGVADTLRDRLRVAQAVCIAG
ncbi:MAG: S1 family peptidase [Alphaproteobacteria bacterium]